MGKWALDFFKALVKIPNSCERPKWDTVQQDLLNINVFLEGTKSLLERNHLVSISAQRWSFTWEAYKSGCSSSPRASLWKLMSYGLRCKLRGPVSLWYVHLTHNEVNRSSSYGISSEKEPDSALLSIDFHSKCFTLEPDFFFFVQGFRFSCQRVNLNLHEPLAARLRMTAG